MTIRKFILFNGATTNVDSYVIPAGGELVATPFETATAGSIPHMPYDFVVSATSGSCTVTIKTSNDDSSYTTGGAFALSSTKSTFSGTGTLDKAFLKMTISAISGATVKGWIRFH